MERMEPPQPAGPPETPLPLADRELVIEAGDIVARVPSRCFRPGARDLKRPIRIPARELIDGLRNGRVVLPLGRIAALCPEIFGDGVHGNRDIPVELPLARLVSQIPEFLAGFSPGAVPGDPVVFERAEGEGLIAASTPLSEDKEMIRLNLSSVLRGARGNIVEGPVDPAATLSVPVEWIEPQLASGRVVFSAAKLAPGAPDAFREAFERAGDIPIEIPLDEVFKCLPGGDEPAPPASPAPAPAAAPAAQQPPAGSREVALASGAPDPFGRRILTGGPAVLQAAQKSTREGGGDAVDRIMSGFPEIAGVAGAAAVFGRDLRLAGEIPGSVDPRAFRDHAWEMLEELARQGALFGMAAPDSITWRTGKGHATLMVRGAVCACAFHAAEDLAPASRAAMSELLDRLVAEL
jgi:hypothetical protein